MIYLIHFYNVEKNDNNTNDITNNITNDIRSIEANNGNEIAVICTDLRKAFNSVPHDPILHKHMKLGLQVRFDMSDPSQISIDIQMSTLT